MPYSQRVLDQLITGGVPVSILVAPAGFGKTNVAKAFAGRHARARIVDAHAVTDAREALDAFGSDGARFDCCVLDDAEALDDDALRATIAGLYERRAGAEAILICTQREPKTFSFIDVVEPHQLQVFRRRELEMTFAEMRACVPAGCDVALATLYAIYYIAHGWPVPTLALIKHAQRRPPGRGFAIDRRHLEDLFDWLETHAVETLPPELRDVLFRCTASRDLTPRDFDRVDPPESMRPDTRLYRNFQRAVLGVAGEIRVHPLLAILLRARHGAELSRYVDEAVDGFLNGGDALRAVRTLIGAGDLARASRILDDVPFEEACDLGGYAYPGLELEILSGSERDYQAHPAIWLHLLPARVFIVPAFRLAREAKRILEIFNGTLPARTRNWIRCAAAKLCVEIGDVELAEGYAELLLDEAGEDGALCRDVAGMYLATSYGRYADAKHCWRRAAPAMERFASHYMMHVATLCAAETRSGNPPEAREMLNAFVSRARLGGTPAYAAFAAMGAALLAWLDNDPSTYVRERREFCRLAFMYPVPLLWQMLAAMFGEDGGGDERAALPLAAIVRASAAHGKSVRAETIANAVRLADDSKDVALRIYARVLSVGGGAPDAARLLDEACALAERTDSRMLRAVVLALRSGATDGAWLIRALLSPAPGVPALAAPSVVERSAASALHVDVTVGEIVRGGAQVRVSEGTLQLMVLLAVAKGAVRRETVLDKLWPDSDGDNANNALKLCVYRARAQLQDAAAIVTSHRSVALGAGVISTFPATLELATRAQIEASEFERAELSEAFERLIRGLASGWAPWEWFIPYRQQLVAAMQGIGAKLLETETARGHHQLAQQIGRAIVGVDPFDEDARALLFGLYRSTGNTVALRKEFAEYRDVLRSAGSEPSPRLKRLANGD